MINTRRFQVSRRENADVRERTRLEKAQNDAIESINKKLRDNNVKIESIIEECEDMDLNHDGVIHPDDLIDAFRNLLPRDTITRREFHHLIAKLTVSKGQSVRYRELADMFGTTRRREKNNEDTEKWHDDIPEIDEFADFDGMKGSIGEWLHRRACPAEVETFKKFIACLELFERESGMRIDPKSNGFDVPLGPDLRATIKFHVR
mmetsp:Transcript_746/g.1239  ORF Transcript_746/g.1239 Transcript_746/m.1239 type:complete len:205 (+) Transcript_746:90-704(+)